MVPATPELCAVPGLHWAVATASSSTPYPLLSWQRKGMLVSSAGPGPTAPAAPSMGLPNSRRPAEGGCEPPSPLSQPRSAPRCAGTNAPHRDSKSHHLPSSKALRTVTRATDHHAYTTDKLAGWHELSAMA